ncbi:TadA family conjugal transfer-associated ATPase [Trujillonella humicola]|uniref:TadA family conjugal transfer-associated ATPase n=1 Tax=Trujillonella humicola TaxID=3383699 RepID=UPI003906A0F8
MTGAPLVERVRARLATEVAVPSRPAVAALVREEAGGLAGDTAVLSAVRAAVDELSGAGPLEELLRAPGVSDVLVNGPDEVWVDRGAGLERAGVRFPDDDAVRRLAVRLAAAAGRRLDDAAPWVDAGLPDGTRLHAVLAPVSARGTCLSLRVLRRCSLGLAELSARGTLPGGSAELLRAVVAARLAFLVTGGTGSGKTTLLSALLGLVEPAERIVVCEDAPELTPAHPHVVGLVTRPPNVEGVGAVALRDLVRQALRMRPDRLVVGEVRGAEVTDLLAALNTGHEGGCGTLHANRSTEVPARLEALGVAAGLDRVAVHSQAAAALAVVVHLRRAGGVRRVEELGVVRRAGDLVVVEPAWRAEGGSCPGRGRLDELLAGGGR